MKVNGNICDSSLLRDIDESMPQLGDSIKKKEKLYDSKLFLPKLAFPNKYNAFTRFRTNNNSAEDAYWERVLPTLNKIWSKEKKQKKQ